MEFDKESTSDFLTNAVSNIFKGDTYSLSFDEIYSTVLFTFPKFGIDFIVKAVLEGLALSLNEERTSLFSQDGEEFNQFLMDMSRRIFQSMGQIKAAFRPIFVNNSGVNCEAEIIKRYREIIFMDEENSQKINNFIIRYAHTLPGSFDIENEAPMIKLLQQVLRPSPLWNMFIEHICQSTDALCLYVTSTLLSQDPCKNNPISYLSAVLDMFSNEEKLWKLLPNEDHEKLHYLMLTCLIYDLKDNYLFTEENKSLIVRAFFDDLKNLDILKKILALFINDNSIISEFVIALFQHFRSVIDNLASEPANSLQASSLVTETIINVFERIRILQSETLLGGSPIFNEMLDDFRGKVLSKDNINFESNAAKTIGLKISNVCSDPSKERELKIFVNEVGKLISYSDNKLLFIDTHNSLMFGRLCMYAGQQYKLEQNVINILEPYMPPSLSEPFQEKLKAFEESEEINKKWIFDDLYLDFCLGIYGQINSQLIKKMEKHETEVNEEHTSLPEYQLLIKQYHCEQFSNLQINLSIFKVDPSSLSIGTYSISHKAVYSDENGQTKNVVIRYLVNDFDDLEFDKYFFDELRCHASLKHETILPLIGFSIPTQDNDSFAVIQEYMPNGSLDGLIQKVKEIQDLPDNWETIKSINIFGIAAGMAFIHQHNNIHRDLKPKTVLLDKNFHPKIGGFNLSKPFKQGTEDEIEQTLNIGTCLYMAPEVTLDCHYSNKVDVFSYSILLYQLLSLNEPYENLLKRNYHNLMKFVHKGIRPTFNDDAIPSPFVELIEKCWSGDPDNRPPFINIVKEFIDKKDDYFGSSLINQNEFNDYIQLVTKDLDFSLVSKK